MSLNSYNLTKQSVVYGMFNQYVFNEVKTNIDLIERYFLMDATTMGNNLIKSLLDAIRKYEFTSIDEPLFRSILASQGKTDHESNDILKEIIKYKLCDTYQIDPIRKYIRGIGSQALLDIAAKRFAGDPEGYIKFLRTNEYKADYSDMFSVTNFDQLDINSVMADSMGGWKSSYDFINKSFQPMEKYENGQIVMVCMPPGCFTEDAKVIVKVKDVECLKPFIIKMEIGQLLEHNKYHQYLIETYNEDTKSYEFSEFECYFTRNAKSLIKVSTSEGDYKCTPDHKWLTEENGWIRADKLTKDMHLLGIYSNTEILGIEKITLDKPIPVYDISIKTNENNHTFRLGCGAVVHNCGKTLFMINECLNMCIQGARCHYLALGDMNQKDFVQRMGAIYSGLSFGDTMRDLPNVFNQLRQIMQGRFNLTILPAAQTTVDEYIEYMLANKDSYDVVFIDYDSNFKPTQADNMYKEGGYIYDNLTKLTKAGKLVFCASQPKIGSWRNDTIELTDAGESSRKQHKFLNCALI